MVAMIAVTALGVVGLNVTPAEATAHHTWRVQPGTGTISAAVANAHPGDTLQLRKGTYYDSVFVPFTLTIRGAGWNRTVIRPPASSSSPCNSSGAMEGICAAGAFDAQGNPDTSMPVRNVDIEDLRVTGFSDSGVFGFNTRGMRVEDVRADHNSGYGIAAFVSTKSVFEDNRASYNGEAGLYRGDSPNADSVIRDNSADHNGIGVFMRDSTELTATGNTVWDNCVGILALWTGGEAAGDIPAGDYRISDNTANDNTMACPGGEHPPLSGMGIGLAGVHDTLVSDNEVHGNHPTGPTIAAGGVAIFSTKFIGGADPTNNRIRDNELSHNQPADIVWDGSGTGNKVRDNDCATAIPGNLGWCSGDHN